MKYLKLVRYHNLIIVILTMCAMRWCVVAPLLKKITVPLDDAGSIYKVLNFQLQLNNFGFALLIIATVCLTAAGYVINDYFDRKTDLVNRPESVIVDKEVHRRVALILHIVLNSIGCLCGFYISWAIGIYKIGIIFLIVAGILWFYSTTFKRQFLIGNLIVALLTALVPLMVVLFELLAVQQFYEARIIIYKVSLLNIFYWVLGFSFFAFITTLLREIIKDVEDFEGDNAYGRNTLPIVLGIKTTKFILVALILLIIAALAVVYTRYVNDNITFWYLLVCLIIPFWILIYKIITASHKSHYRFASGLLKIIMLLGLSYSIVGKYIIDSF